MSWWFEPAQQTVNENAGYVSFRLMRTWSGSPAPVYVSTYYTKDTQNKGDYTGLSNVAVSFQPYQTAQTISVGILNDSTSESDETFYLIAQASKWDPLSTYLARASFTIRDDDAAPVDRWTVSPPSRVVDEDDTTITFTVSRGNDVGYDTVYVSTVQDRGFANHGDYLGKRNEPLQFGAGEAAKTITIHISEDTDPEPNETYSLIVQQNATDPVSTYLARSSFTIVDDDTVPRSTDWMLTAPKRFWKMRRAFPSKSAGPIRAVPKRSTSQRSIRQSTDMTLTRMTTSAYATSH